MGVVVPTGSEMTGKPTEMHVALQQIRTMVEMLKHFGVRFLVGRAGQLERDVIEDRQVGKTERQSEQVFGQKKRQESFFQAPEPNLSGGEPAKDVWLPNALSLEQVRSKLDEIRAEMGQCSRCGLHAGRNNLVFGEGNPKTQLVLVGEGPGREEDRTGRPFVGRAGQLLDRILAAMGYRREEVYICNVVKCRPPDNRVPQDEEMRTCGLFLAKQLEAIQPRHILALGSTAVKYLIGSNQPMSKLRGRFFAYRNGAKILPTYHPAYLLRNPAAKKLVWEDVQKIMSETHRLGPKSMESFGS